MELSEWQKILAVNATGVFLCSRAAARLMVAGNIEGSIVSISSIAGKIGDPGLAHYSASKFAVVGFTQSLAQELAPHGITVNAICPGVVMTPMIEDLAQDWDASIEEMMSAQAIKRPQTPSEIAAAVLYLHTVRSVTGQAINVDGGTVFH
jgi:NAD(P)-dependent dehydrogenase (short-subunit alcohol dehydrogenase family)